MSKKSLKNQSIERRQSPRQRLKTMVKLVAGENEATEESENISLTGLFIKSNTPGNYQINDTVEVSFTNQEGEDQKRTGKIIRKTDKGIAVLYGEIMDLLHLNKS